MAGGAGGGVPYHDIPARSVAGQAGFVRLRFDDEQDICGTPAVGSDLDARSSARIPADVDLDAAVGIPATEEFGRLVEAHSDDAMSQSHHLALKWRHRSSLAIAEGLKADNVT